MKNKKISLLPYIREDIYGLSYGDCQLIGWEIEKFDIKKQWNKSKGENVVVAVVDTGCDLDHPDISNNLLKGKNFIDNKDPIDDNGHGTHVSSTIAAENNVIGMVGVAPKTKIIPVKSLDKNGNGSVETIVKGIAWSVDNGADIITMSLGSPNPSKEIEDVINYAIKNNVAIFCAAGNSGENVDIMYPAKYNGTISIGAIDKNLNRTNFTCSGETLDFLAPGHNILGCVPDNSYAIMSGTSMSNPFAVGCASLLLSDIRKLDKNKKLSIEEYIEYFKKYSKPLKDKKHQSKKYQGYGILYPCV